MVTYNQDLEVVGIRRTFNIKALLFIFLKIYLRGGGRMCVCERGEGQRETESQADPLLSVEPNEGLDPMTQRP